MTLERLTEMVEEIDAALRPATDDQVAIAVERLRANYPEFEDLDDPVLEMVIEDMLNDMAGFPHEMLVEACRRWRNSPAARAPTAGQLKAMVELDVRRLERMRFILNEAIAEAHP